MKGFGTQNVGEEKAHRSGLRDNLLSLVNYCESRTQVVHGLHDVKVLTF